MADKRLSLKDYCDINNRFCAFMMDKVLQGDKVELPCNLGHVDVFGRMYDLKLDDTGKPIATCVDWKATKELWKKYPEYGKGDNKKMVYHVNEHTDGYRYKFLWDKQATENVKNKALYSLQPSRANKRTLAAHIKAAAYPYRLIKRRY